MTSTLQLYPAVVFDSTPTEFGEDVEAAVEEIREACQGWGTDEAALVTALATKTPEMRHLVNVLYEQKYEEDMRRRVKSELGEGDFGVALTLLACGPALADAYILAKAFDGFGTKERLIWPVLCGRCNEDIAQLKEVFFNLREKDMGVEVASELGGDFERLIFHCIQGLEEPYDEDFHTAEKAEEDAATFEAAGEGQWGTDEKSLFEIIAKSPPEHLEKINEIYVEKYEKTLINALDNELGGDVSKGARYAVGMKLKPYETAAKLVKGTCAGFGTDELGFTCAIIRYVPIMKQVNEAFTELFEKSILELIEEEIGGQYKDLLTQVVESALA